MAPTAYRTFSRKLAPSLTALGGALAILGGLGPWVRATEVKSEGLVPEQVAVSMGYHSEWGVVIAILGAVAIVASLIWFTRRLIFKLVPFGVAIAVAVLAAWRLSFIAQDAKDMADRAQEQLGFVNYHAGFGWGAWLLLLGAVLAGLGAVAGALRELDVRKGVPE